MAISLESKRGFYSLVRQKFLRLIIAIIVCSGVEGMRLSSHRNKGVVSTIMSEDGDIVDCVDIYKQPAFDHPLLKNHTIKMSPSFIPPTVEGNYSFRSHFQQIWQKNGSCPEGTVPIQRPRGSNLTTIGELSGNYQLNGEFSNCKVEVARLEMQKEGPYIGATGTISAWNINIEGKEWSLNSFSIFNKENSFMENGWAASLILFGDTKPRLFVNWMATNQGCFNLRCPGFVQVANHILLGGALLYVSEINGEQFDYEFTTFKDVSNGIWWAMFQGEAIGYWPISLFENFDSVRRINWGGSVCNSRFVGSHTLTEMGSGVMAEFRYKRAAYIRRIMTMNSDRKFIVPQFSFLSASCPKCYDVIDCFDFKHDAGACLYYGGPGGRDCDQHCKCLHC